MMSRPWGAGKESFFYSSLTGAQSGPFQVLSSRLLLALLPHDLQPANHTQCKQDLATFHHAHCYLSASSSQSSFSWTIAIASQLGSLFWPVLPSLPNRTATVTSKTVSQGKPPSVWSPSYFTWGSESVSNDLQGPAHHPLPHQLRVLFSQEEDDSCPLPLQLFVSKEASSGGQRSFPQEVHTEHSI